MPEQRWFYKSAEDWDALRERLKLTPCPHCQVVGMLIQHGFLRGYDDRSSRRQTVRGRRLLCSNRHKRRGCGRTFSVWCADQIRRLSVTTATLWQFLKRAVAGSIAAAIHAADGYLSDRTWQRLWRRFHQAQSTIRTALCSTCPPPDLPAAASPRPAAHVLAHLKAAFPDADCPIAAFQHALRTFFL